jgi:hypothetical protein
VLEAHLLVQVENGLPLGGKVTLYFSRVRSDSTIFELDTLDNSNDHYVLPLHLRAGIATGGPPALVTTPVSSMLRVDLDSHNLPLFHENEMLFWALKMETDQTGVMVKVRPTDYLDVNAQISARVRAKFNGDDEEGGAS